MHMRVQLANDYSLIVLKLHKIVDNAIGCERAIRLDYEFLVSSFDFIRFAVDCRTIGCIFKFVTEKKDEDKKPIVP